jgi:pyridinium-3,5-biscarboxylic acid mononucleotide sulfurtransferase
MTLAEKHQKLRELIAECGSAVVCFSGGVDSTFLLRVAHDVLGDKCIALIAVSPTMAKSEQRAARELAAAMGVRCEVMESHELLREEFKNNPKDRCYYCKSELLTIAAPVAQRMGMQAVLVGTNVDDLGDYRPGMQAAKDHGARHPLLDAGLNKQEIRELSRELGLTTWDKPQLACLSSRFPYGTEITPERLRQVDDFEDGLRELGFRQLRVRYHNEVARIELEAEAMPRALEQRESIVKLGKRLGFTFVSLDLAGFTSGSLNQLIGIRPSKSPSQG